MRKVSKKSFKMLKENYQLHHYIQEEILTKVKLL